MLKWAMPHLYLPVLLKGLNGNLFVPGHHVHQTYFFLFCLWHIRPCFELSNKWDRPRDCRDPAKANTEDSIWLKSGQTMAFRRCSAVPCSIRKDLFALKNDKVTLFSFGSNARARPTANVIVTLLIGDRRQLQMTAACGSRLAIMISAFTTERVWVSTLSLCWVSIGDAQYSWILTALFLHCQEPWSKIHAIFSGFCWLEILVGSKVCSYIGHWRDRNSFYPVHDLCVQHDSLVPLYPIFNTIQKISFLASSR